MNIEYRAGDAIKGTAPGEGLAHGCNGYGVMGAGIAKQVRQLFPETYAVYHDQCVHNEIHAGDCLVVPENDIFVFNCLTQHQPGPNAHLVYVDISFRWMVYLAKDLGVNVINMPKIGCGIGGLVWEDVEAVIRDIESDIQINVYTL